MKPSSFVHAADLHLGFAQYNLETRWADFDKAFKEPVERTLELKPDLLIMAGDTLQQVRPKQHTGKRHPKP